MVVLASDSQPWHGQMLPSSAVSESADCVRVSPHSASASTSATPLTLRLSAADLQDFCRRQGLAGFKLPRVIVAQRCVLPTNASGKVLKHLIRARLGSALKEGPNSKL